MTDIKYKIYSQKILDEYKKAIQEPVTQEKIYLGVKNNKYLVIEWTKYFSFLIEKYPDHLYYSKFQFWEGVEMFLANNNNKDIIIIK